MHRLVSRRSRGGALVLGAALLSTGIGSCTKSPTMMPAASAVVYDPPAPTLRRLTQAQFKNAIADVFGSDVVVAGTLEPDTAIEDFFSVGAGETSISSRGVSQYESIAYDVASQVLKSDAHRAAILTCQPTGPGDADCAGKALGALGKRLWRRPLTDEEAAEIVKIATQAGTTLADFNQGLQFGIAALLQSPNFLFRSEAGAPEATPAAGQPATAKLTGWELAARLSFFLWNGPPDDALLAAAAAGTLDTADGVAAQVTRMMGSPLARRGLRNFATEWLALWQLDDLVKDPKVFTQISPDVGPAAREETLQDIEHIAFDLDADFRDLFTTRDTYINRKLASIYGVRAPSTDGFALATLPMDQPRRGLLGQVATLAVGAHPTTSSPTLRGKFIRIVLLCDRVPPPPANLNVALPPVSPDAKTLRMRLTSHASIAACSSCHHLMDPIGLGLENFDGLGVYRPTDNDAAIDASGDLDGKAFRDASDLAQVIHDHPNVGPCLARRLFRYAVGHLESIGEEAEIQHLADGYAAAGYRMQKLMIAIATSDAFRRTGLTTVASN